MTKEQLERLKKAEDLCGEATLLIESIEDALNKSDPGAPEADVLRSAYESAYSALCELADLRMNIAQLERAAIAKRAQEAAEEFNRSG